MEERIIDEEYGRGIRMKKTGDGNVDVTDALAPQTDDEGGEEALFEFPDLEGLEEDDEELATLSPEEALALKKKRAEEAKKREEEYAALIKEGEKLLKEGEYAKAAETYEKAIPLVGDATVAAVGYWQAKTENYTLPDALAEEYSGEEIEEFYLDVGDEAAEKIKTGLMPEIERRKAALTAEKEPLEKEVMEKQAARRKVLKERLRSARFGFWATFVPTALFLVTAIVLALNINTRPDQLYLYMSIGFAAAFLLSFIVFCVASNKYYNARRMNRKNERLSSTETGKKYVEITAKLSFYDAFIKYLPTANEKVDEEADEENEKDAEAEKSEDTNEKAE